MSEENLIPEMLAGETPKAYQGFIDYCRLGGASRSLSNLETLYKSSTVDVPTTSLRTLKEWSTVHNWQERIRIYDQRLQASLETAIKERRLSLLDKFGIVVETAIENVNLDDVSLSQVTGALKEYLAQSMALFNELPVNRIQVETDNLQDVSTNDLRLKASELLSRLKLSEKQPENTFSLPHNDNLYQPPQISA